MRQGRAGRHVDRRDPPRRRLTAHRTPPSGGSLQRPMPMETAVRTVRTSVEGGKSGDLRILRRVRARDRHRSRLPRADAAFAVSPLDPSWQPPASGVPLAASPGLRSRQFAAAPPVVPSTPPVAAPAGALTSPPSSPGAAPRPSQRPSTFRPAARGRAGGRARRRTGTAVRAVAPAARPPPAPSSPPRHDPAPAATGPSRPRPRRTPSRSPSPRRSRAPTHERSTEEGAQAERRQPPRPARDRARAGRLRPAPDHRRRARSSGCNGAPDAARGLPRADAARSSSGSCTRRSPRSSGRSSRRTSSSTSPTPCPGKARFRVNMYRQRDSLGAAFRLIPFEIKKLEDLGIPPSVANFAMLPRGFVLVTGPTGSGKSTTLASLVDLANRNRRDHIMTVEDPIEFLHRHQSLPGQPARGGGGHALLRQRPQARAAAGPRHHPGRRDARPGDDLGRADRRRDRPPRLRHPAHPGRGADDRPHHRRLPAAPAAAGARPAGRLAPGRRLPDAGTHARTAAAESVATEVLVATPAIRNLIREGKTHQIYSAMQAGAQHGMHTIDQHLAELVKRGPDHVRDRPREVPPHRGLQPSDRPGLRGRRHGSHDDVPVLGPRPRREAGQRASSTPTRQAAVAHEAQDAWATRRSASPQASTGGMNKEITHPGLRRRRSSSRTWRSCRGSSRR